jgi:hypothetical protein
MTTLPNKYKYSDNPTFTVHVLVWSLKHIIHQSCAVLICPTIVESVANTAILFIGVKMTLIF